MASWTHPDDTPPGVTPETNAHALRRAAEHMRELEDDSATLTVAGGDEVTIICVATVREWLHGLAIRAEAGERL